ncbi:hypothetical protein [Enterococcus casseliflavus]|uniref:hypothetical protein n=1 Tax=Enterococcus casseliflavus TaxID=37734 RepID=UPI0030180FB7
MTTTKKAFRDQVRSYILDNIEDNNIIELVNQYKRENSPKQIKGFSDIQNAFIYWLQGLPTGVNFYFTNFEIENLLKEWFKNADMEYKEKEDFTDNYYYFLYREIAYLFEKETKESLVSYVLK